MMSGIDFARRTEALDHVSQALALLDRVQIRWRRYADTTPLANAAEPVAIILRTTKNILARSTDIHLADTPRMLHEVIVAMQKLKRDELPSVIEKAQAAYEAVLNRR
jgi:hypothetical protein